jgi:hypothetical protein
LDDKTARSTALEGLNFWLLVVREPVTLSRSQGPRCQLITRNSRCSVHAALLMVFVLMCLMATSYAQGLNRMALLLPGWFGKIHRIERHRVDGRCVGAGFCAAPVPQRRSADPGACTSRSIGLIVPDQIQVTTSDACDHLKTCVAQGGNLCWWDDAGAFDCRRVLCCSSPGSATASITRCTTSLDRTVGLGPVNGLVSTLRSLQVPPGEIRYHAPASDDYRRTC